jgi:hypothetical protein
MKMYAICDTDGGRKQPEPLARYIYATEDAAKQAADYRGFDREHYPVMEISVEIQRNSGDLFS